MNGPYGWNLTVMKIKGILWRVKTERSYKLDGQKGWKWMALTTKRKQSKESFFDVHLKWKWTILKGRSKRAKLHDLVEWKLTVFLDLEKTEYIILITYHIFQWIRIFFHSSLFLVLLHINLFLFLNSKYSLSKFFKTVFFSIYGFCFFKMTFSFFVFMLFVSR